MDIFSSQGRSSALGSALPSCSSSRVYALRCLEFGSLERFGAAEEVEIEHCSFHLRRRNLRRRNPRKFFTDGRLRARLSNYSSFEGVLYCKPHFDQLFKMTGSLDKSFEGAPRIARVDKSVDQVHHNNNRVSSLFGGTQEKCVACKKTVYPLEKVAVDGTSYHRPCFKCSHGGCVISPSNYVAHEGSLYCKHHHSQLFKAKGNFSQLGKHEPPKEVIANTVSE